jgi:hypothetical protein
MLLSSTASSVVSWCGNNFVSSYFLELACVCYYMGVSTAYLLGLLYVRGRVVWWFSLCGVTKQNFITVA